MSFDAARHAGAVVRKVEDREHEGKPARVVVASRRYATDIDDAWDALTNAERIPRWFLPISGDLRPGGRYQLEGNAGGTITECEPPRRLAVTWEYGGSTSWVFARLSEEDDGQTLLELEHVAHLDEEFMKFWGEYGAGAGGVGWDLGLMALAEHLATGEAVTEEAASWPLTDEGKGFVGECSEGWARASIAAGIDEEHAAMDAAERTTAFYTQAPPES